MILPPQPDGAGVLHLGSLAPANNAFELMSWDINHVYHLMLCG